MLCEYSKDISGNNQVQLLCIITNQACGYYRWCSNDQRIKMTDKYSECRIRGEKMKEVKPKQDVETKVEKEVISNSNIKTNSEICKVVLSKDGDIYFNMSDCGLKYKFNANVGDNVKVEFKSEIGKADFEIINVDLA